MIADCFTGLMDLTDNLKKYNKTFLIFQLNYTRLLKIILHGSETC